MTIWRRLCSDGGQASVETLALLPLVTAAAVGLCGVGVWLRDEHSAESAAASRAVEVIETATLQRSQRSGGSLGASDRVALRHSGGATEVVATSSAAAGFFGIPMNGTARLRWAGG